MRPSTRELARAALFTALIAAGALITIPAGPVPFTLQVMMVLLAGLVLGPRLAVLATVAYLALGLVAPVYAGGASGIAVLIGPTGGYLLGFVVAAGLTGMLSRRSPQPSLRRFAVAACAGLVPIYALGAAWLSVQLGTADPGVVLVGGVLQFVPLDFVKAVAAAALARALAVTLPQDAAALRSGR